MTRIAQYGRYGQPCQACGYIDIATLGFDFGAPFGYSTNWLQRIRLRTDISGQDFSTAERIWLNDTLLPFKAFVSEGLGCDIIAFRWEPSEETQTADLIAYRVAAANGIANEIWRLTIYVGAVSHTGYTAPSIMQGRDGLLFVNLRTQFMMINDADGEILAAGTFEPDQEVVASPAGDNLTWSHYNRISYLFEFPYNNLLLPIKHDKLLAGISWYIHCFYPTQANQFIIPMVSGFAELDFANNRWKAGKCVIPADAPTYVNQAIPGCFIPSPDYYCQFVPPEICGNKVDLDNNAIRADSLFGLGDFAFNGYYFLKNAGNVNHLYRIPTETGWAGVDNFERIVYLGTGQPVELVAQNIRGVRCRKLYLTGWLSSARYDLVTQEIVEFPFWLYPAFGILADATPGGDAECQSTDVCGAAESQPSCPTCVQLTPPQISFPPDVPRHECQLRDFIIKDEPGEGDSPIILGQCDGEPIPIRRIYFFSYFRHCATDTSPAPPQPQCISEASGECPDIICYEEDNDPSLCPNRNLFNRARVCTLAEISPACLQGITDVVNKLCKPVTPAGARHWCTKHLIVAVEDQCGQFACISQPVSFDFSEPNNCCCSLLHFQLHVILTEIREVCFGGGEYRGREYVYYVSVKRADNPEPDFRVCDPPGNECGTQWVITNEKIQGASTPPDICNDINPGDSYDVPCGAANPEQSDPTLWGTFSHVVRVLPGPSNDPVCTQYRITAKTDAGRCRGKVDLFYGCLEPA